MLNLNEKDFLKHKIRLETMILNDVYITYIIEGAQSQCSGSINLCEDNADHAFMSNFSPKKIKIKIKAPFYIFNNLKLEIIKFRGMFDKLKKTTTSPNITMLKIYNFIRDIICSDKLLTKVSDVFKLINNDVPKMLSEEDRKKLIINKNHELWEFLDKLSINIWHR